MCLTPGQLRYPFFRMCTLVARSERPALRILFFSTSARQFFYSHRLNPLNTTGVNSRCCLSCTCAHIRACAYECSHLLLFTARRAPLCQVVQNTHGCQIGIRSLLVRFHGIVVPGLLHNSLWSCRPVAQRRRDRLSPADLV